MVSTKQGFNENLSFKVFEITRTHCVSYKAFNTVKPPNNSGHPK